MTGQVIAFPAPKLERYEILYDPTTHKVDIPFLPDDNFAAMVVLGVFADMLLEAGSIDITDLDTTIEGVKIARK